MDFDNVKSTYMVNRIHFIGEDKSPKMRGNVSCVFGCCTFVSERISMSYNHH